MDGALASIGEPVTIGVGIQWVGPQGLFVPIAKVVVVRILGGRVRTGFLLRAVVEIVTIRIIRGILGQIAYLDQFPGILEAVVVAVDGLGR